MADVPAPFLTMRKITGTVEAPGAADNPVILGWANAIADRFPKMLSYCAQYNHDEIAWCGLTVAYCMATNGIEPPFGAEDEDRFLWVDSWKTFGTPVAKDDAQTGDVLIFTGGGMHHVTMLDHVSGDSFVCLGGNQGDQVKLSTYPKSSCSAVRRAPAPAAVPMPMGPAIVVSKANNFDACLAVVLKWEGGNDDDPNDPGGRTSRGILQKEWDVYRQNKPGLPSDVWKAAQSDIVAIYHQSYWDVVWGDDLPPGVDLAVFDMAVLQGVGRVTDLQQIVGTDVDGEVGPNTIAAVQKYVDNVGAVNLVNAVCDARMARLKGSKNWGRYGKGWENRVNDIRKQGAAMVGKATQPAPQPVPEPQPQPEPVPVPQPGPIAVPFEVAVRAELFTIKRRLSALEDHDMNDVEQEAPAAAPATQAGAAQQIDLSVILRAVQELRMQMPAIVQRVDQLQKTFENLKAGGGVGGFLSGMIPASTGMSPSAVDPVTATPIVTAPAAAVDAKNKTGLGAGVLGTIAALALGAAGVTGTPMGVDASTTGQLLPLATTGIAALGAFGKLAPILRALALVL